MKAVQHILFLNLYTFSLTGGIEKVNRALVKALGKLSESGSITSFQQFSMYDTAADENYVEKVYFKGFSGKKIHFALAVFRQTLSMDMVILSHINLLVFAKLIKLIMPKTRIIVMAHGIEVWRDLPKWKSNLLKHCEIWSVSRFTAQKMIEKHQIPKENISILNNCLDPYFEVPNHFEKPSELLKRYKITEKQPIIYTLTRLSSAEQYKGYDVVIKSLVEVRKNHPQIHYLLAGKADDLERKRLEKLIALYNLEKNVTLAGFINDNEVQAHYILADVFAMPSTGEGFGISFIEAAACGCPVIGGNQDGSTDALLDGKIGTLINPTDEKELAKTIINQLSTPKTATNIQQLQHTCLAYFSFDSYVAKVTQLLKNNIN